MPPPLDPQKIDAFAELLAGRPCIQAEAYRAANISESSAKKLLKDEGFQAKVKAARRRFSGIVSDAKAVVESLLGATDDEGEPAYGLQKMGAELALKYGEVLDVDMDDVDVDALPAGVVRVYPAQYDEGERAAAEDSPAPLPEEVEDEDDDEPADDGGEDGDGEPAHPSLPA